VVLASALFLAVIGFAVIAMRRPLARLQALVLGGSVLPGCAVAEGVVLLLIAAAILLFGKSLDG
jgi:hypothetical protein